MSSKSKNAELFFSPPGDTIKEHLEFEGMSQAELAARMGRPKEKINDLIKGREPITIKTAFQLEKVLNVPAKFWLVREQNHQIQLFEFEQQNKYSKEKKWLLTFPIEEMQYLNWIPKSKSVADQINLLLNYFRIASPNEWDKIYSEAQKTVSFRLNITSTYCPNSTAAWLRQGEIQSKELEIREYNSKKFNNFIRNIKTEFDSQKTDFKKAIQQKCAAMGVALVFTPNLSQTTIIGAARWFSKKPLIQISENLTDKKQIWFTFLHEAAHIILHNKKEIYIENNSSHQANETKEIEADEFATRLLNTLFK